MILRTYKYQQHVVVNNKKIAYSHCINTIIRQVVPFIYRSMRERDTRNKDVFVTVDHVNIYCFGL